ncbi:Dbl-like domain-containing protein [Rhodofomes roseus]|uniref:Dbl-like domain-containing protein n=1 Tax=Rhodofomes roseus TaxID=34475 RepID=A0ABQ8KMP2_9APHY|nr:Dbl-like domain-containing protein [Rhodofomes roseus]KAH9839689.1 Dbl-like domain-containing protein [Rhodofomes roseus]
MHDVVRTTSVGSTTSSGYNSSVISYANGPSQLDRNPSVATTVSISSLYASSTGSPNLYSGSSAATTVDRGNSFQSHTSKASETWTQPGPSYEHSPAPSHSYLQAQTPTPGQISRTSSAQGPVGSSSRSWKDNDVIRTLQDIKRPLELAGDWHDEEEDDFFDEDQSEEGDDRFFNPSLLSHIAVRLRDKVPRGTHVKGSIPYPRAFTGKDIVSTIQSHIQRELLITHGISTNDRRAALQVARSLQNQLFFYEVEWGGRVLQDGVEDVYMFLDDQEGASDTRVEREELPTAVITLLTRCYAPSCYDETPCYSFACPKRNKSLVLATPTEKEVEEEKDDSWSRTVPPEVLRTLPESEINRQTIIHKVINKEKQYLRDLDIVESLFIRPLRSANPPVIRLSEVEEFIEEVFGNILDLRECNRRLLEVLNVRQREQAPIIQGVGDIFLDAATEFRLAYPIYVGHLPVAEKRVKDESEKNAEFRRFLEQAARHPDAHRLDLKHFLNRPSEHLQKYPVLLEAICNETTVGNPDEDFLKEAIEAIRKLQTVAQLWTWQSAMGKGATGKLEWHNLVSEEFRKSLPKKEAKRQSIIFELIKGEMEYVKDLENIDLMYVTPLREMDPPIVPRDRLEQFLREVFHNFDELHAHHRKMLNSFHEIQREEHPVIRSVTAAVYDAVLNFREAYLEYIPNYPIAAYRIDDEMANNAQFQTFVDQCTRHPDARKLDMKAFINRPIPRLLRYELLLRSILDETPEGHEDRDTIPQVLELIKALGKDSEPGVVSAKQKVEVWRYNSNLVFKPGEAIDMDLLNENRSLMHTGKFLRQPDTGFEWSGWTELFVLLFDNYLVMTKPKEKDGITRYHVYRRPIPLDLLTLANFTDPPTQRSGGILRLGGLNSRVERNPDGPPPGANGTPDSATDSRMVYPCTIHHTGRLGGLYTVFAESVQVRNEWKQKLEEAIGLRKVVQESNKVFEVETLSSDTFFVPAVVPGGGSAAYNHENAFTGKVTCSVPFTTADGRGLVAVGCAEGVWIGFRHDSRSMRRVLHLKMVTQCAMLEDFGIFLVLADKSLFAYHIEALVPSSPQSVNTSQTPQKLSGNKDVHFFSVGNLNGRTLVIYMKKKGLDSVFRVLEPVVGKINERAEAPRTFGSRLGLRSQRSEWFRVYRDFFLPSESFDLIFLKARIVILCTKGFEIMDLTDFKSVTIPQRDDPRLEKLAKRCESCRPMGMFRTNQDEFLLCYDEFGLYVDRHGDPSRGMGTIEWEGTAEHVAWHPPYVLLFDTRFIEIRHVETGRLAQIIPGNDVRCIWDGRGTANVPTSTVPGPDGWTEGISQEPRVHGVMNADNGLQPSGPRGARPIAQHVFELIPTIPLYLPGSLSSPSHATQFAQSNSPPHSPRLNPSLSFR